MKAVRTRRALFDVAVLEARRMFCMEGDHAGLSTSPSPGGFEPNSLEMPAGEAVAASVDTLIVPAYSSRPSAGRKLYLDFNGHGAIDNWNGWSEFGGHSVSATHAYDIDGNNNNFSTQELANILQIWKGVSEKFSPFNVDVTTVRPNTINGVRVVIGGDGAWYGRGGGVASIGGWGEEGFTDANSGNVAFVWNGQGADDSSPNYIIEAAAHEAGHTLDLYHQSFLPLNGAGNEYAAGFIMGSGGRWANTAVNGTTSSSRDDDGVQNEGSQNDLNVITGDNGFGFRADDYGNLISTASTLTLASVSGVLEGAAGGVIEQMTDADVFRINHTGGSLNIEVLGAEFGRMLDPRVELLTSTGTLIEFSATNDGSEAGGERIQLNQLNAGTYYISIFGSTAYGDIGQFRLKVSAGLATTAFNDTVTTATTLYAFGNTDFATWGSIGYAGTSTINDSLASNDTIDYFKFRAPANTNQVFARLSGLTTTASLAVYNDLNGNGIIETGEFVGANNPGTGIQTVSSSFVSAGTNYYVRVMKGSSAGNGNYQLRITTDAAPTSLPATAVGATFDGPLRGGKFVYDSLDSLAGDTVDYYRVNAESNGLFSIYMYDSSFTGADLRLDIGRDLNSNGVFDSGEITHTSAVAGQTTEFVQNIAVTQGQQLLVRVSQQAAGASSNYYVQAVADYATGGNTNGSLVGAKDMTNRAAGTIFEYLDGATDLFDTFRIAPTTGAMQARFNSLDLGASHKLEIIRDGNGNNTVDAGEIVASGFNNQLLNYNVIAGGTYFLRVQSILNGEFFSTGNYKVAYVTAGAVTSFGTLGNAGAITMSPSQSALVNFLNFDPTEPGQTNTSDYYRFTLGSRTRVDLSINTLFLPPPASAFGIAIGQDDGSGNFKRLTGLGVNQGIQTAMNVNLDPGTYYIRAYLPVAERQTDAIGGNYSLLFNTAAITDNAAPVVTASAHQFEIAPVGASFTFDQDVVGSVGVNDVEIRNLATNALSPIGSVFYDATLKRAGYGVASRTLPDGNYRATLLAGAVRDASANPNAAASSVDFFVFAGDANRDRRVDISDFAVLASRFNQQGTFSQGDFNYDHKTDIADFSILASKFNQTLPAARAMPPAPTATSVAKSPAAFGATRIDESTEEELILI